MSTVTEYLNRSHARYTTIPHAPAFTAQEVAAVSHISGRNLAKTVMVKINGDLAMVVLPADRRLDLERLKTITKSHCVRLAREEEFAAIFPDCEVGAMPPLGDLYGVDVYAARELAENDVIACNGGSHTELIELPYAEFRRLARPVVADLCIRR